MLVKDLKPNPKNPRKISDSKLKQLEKSLKFYGSLDGFVYNKKTGNLISGHQRAKIFQEATIEGNFVLWEGKKFPYREVNWSEQKEKAATIVANRHGGEWDMPQLSEWMKDLDSFDSDFEMDLTMWDEDERKQFKSVDKTENEFQEADPPEPEEKEEPEEKPNKLFGEAQIFNGDSLDILKTFPDNSIDSLVTDPPYGWRFMGKAWDGEDIEKKAKQTLGDTPKTKLCKDGKIRMRKIQIAQEAGAYDLSVKGNSAFQKFSEEWAREVYRVLKPGGHAIIFCGPRTYHRMACGVEDAGFEIRDQLQWLFGSGFPKSLDISKAIDKAAGAEREVIGEYQRPDGAARNYKNWSGKKENDLFDTSHKTLSVPNSNDAKKWQGFGTALKPANEPILLARKPLSEKTVAQNVLKWGTGGLNIDACRIGTQEKLTSNRHKPYDFKNPSGYKDTNRTEFVQNPQGRFPSNLLLDETAAEMLDAQSGILVSKYSAVKESTIRKGSSFDTGVKNIQNVNSYVGDKGGASRFFFIANSDKFSQCAKDNVDSVKNYSNQSEVLVNFVQEVAEIKVDQEAKPLKDLIQAFTHDIQNKLNQNVNPITPLILSTVEKFLHELKHIENSSSNLAKLAELKKLIGITITTLNLLTCDGYAENVILLSTQKKEGVGEKVYASKFLYCAKTSKSERNAGLEGMEKGLGKRNFSQGMEYKLQADGSKTSIEQIPESNTHPTVKPVSLMRYLCKLITPPNAIVLDPFMGSGSTGVAALQEGFKFIGIEREKEYFDICEKRLNYKKNKVQLLCNQKAANNAPRKYKKS